MKQVLLWTNCQGGTISYMLSKYHSDKFELKHYLNYEYIRENKTLPEEFKNADIFIYQNYNSDKHGKDYDLDHIINNVLKPECKKICIPFLYFEAMFSYDMRQSKNNFKTISSNAPFGKFFFGINFIDDKLTDIDTKNYTEEDKEALIESIYQDFISEKAISEEKIKHYYDRSFEYLKNKILSSDVPDIFEYIETNFKNIRLWHNRNHPTGILLIELVKEVFKILDLDYTDNEEDINVLNKSINDWVMPIPLCVKKYYGMEFSDECSSWTDSSIIDTKSFIKSYVKAMFFDFL